MKNSKQFLDAIMARHGLTSDYQLAKFLGIRQQRISIYRHHGAFDDDTCIMVAAALGLEPSYVMACIAAERTKSAKAKAAWQHAAELLGGLAAVLAIMAILPFVNLPDAGLVRVAEASALFDNNIHYAKLLLTGLALIIITLLSSPDKKHDDSQPR